MSAGPPLTLEALHLFQLFGAKGFADALPPGCGDVAEAAQQAYTQGLAAAAASANCRTCLSLPGALREARNLLGRRLAILAGTEPSLLAPLGDLVARKRGYRPTPIVLYYEDDGGRTASVRF